MPDVPVELYGILVPTVIAAVIRVAYIPYFDRKFAPLVAIGLGLVVSFAYYYEAKAWTLGQALLYGLMFGVLAVGGYSAQKNIAQGLSLRRTRNQANFQG